jgi:hypothetical protein
MRGTDTQIRLLLGQLRKARDEVARAWMMMAAVEAGDEEELEDMVDTLAAIIDSVVKADEVEDDGP